MGQLQFRSDDTVKWKEGFGKGTDGDLVISGNSTEAPIDASCTGTAGQSTLSATNASFAAGQLLLIHKTRGNTTTNAGTWELNKIVSYVAGTITLKYPLQNTYNDDGAANQSQVRVLPQYNNVTINAGVTYTAKPWDGNVGGILSFFAKGTLTIAGTINVAGGNSTDTAGNPGTPGQFHFKGGARGNSTPYCGEGSAGPSTTNYGQNGSGGSGAPTSPTDVGSGGGHATQGGSGGNPGNIGGAAVGTADLVNMQMGGAGGGGRDTGNPSNAGNGGGGGGIAALFAQIIATITGAINVNGGSTGTNYWKGGNGAGGSCLLKCVTGNAGANKITATPGTGPGTSASNGRIHVDYKDSFTGTTNPTLDARQDATLKYVGGAAILRKLAE